MTSAYSGEPTSRSSAGASPPSIGRADSITNYVVSTNGGPSTSVGLVLTDAVTGYEWDGLYGPSPRRQWRRRERREPGQYRDDGDATDGAQRPDLLTAAAGEYDGVVYLHPAGEHRWQRD